MVKPEQEVRAARQDLYNLIAELCSFITKKDSDNYLVSYSCLSEEEELRIEERIEKNTPLAVSSGGAFVVIRDTDLTEEFLKNLRLFSTALVLDDDRNCIMKLLQTLDGALYLILQDEMERMSIHPGHMTENADPADYDRLEQGTSLELRGILEGLKTGRMALCKVETGEEIPVCCAYTDRQQDILLAGGLLKYVAKENA